MTVITRNRPMSRLMLATLLVAGAAAVALPSWARPMGGMGPDGPGPMAHMGPGDRMGPGMHGDMGPMGLSPRMLDAVKATPEQRTQLQQIMEAARKDLQALRESGRSLRDEHLALFSQPNVDARAAEALRQKQMALREQASKRQMQAALDASRVLTPEQRKQLADTMQKRRQMMERHLQERRAMDAPKS